MTLMAHKYFIKKLLNRLDFSFIFLIIKKKMKNLFFIISILIFPYIIMLIVNQSVYETSYNKTIFGYNIKTHNPHSFSKTKCTWSCHHNTSSCEKYHIKHQSIKEVDFIYDKIIKLLYSGGSKFYAINNIIFLVLLWPLWMLYMFIRVCLSFKK